jgi:hypothetical protein
MFHYTANGNYNIREDFGNKQNFGPYLGSNFTKSNSFRGAKDMVQAITSREKCKQKNIEADKINERHLKNMNNNIAKISRECESKKKSLEAEVNNLISEFNKSKAIADKRGSTQAQKNKFKQDEINLNAKKKELENHNTNCTKSITQERISYSNNLLPKYWERNLNFKVWAGMPFEQTSHICCPVTHREIGHMTYNQLDGFHVCYK